MSERLIAIGDIHGCSVALRTLIDAVDPGPNDIVVTLGDYVDRGPDSRGVIDELIALGQRTQLVPLLGNHEEMMMDVVRGHQPHHNWIRFGGIDTLESYGFDGELNFLPSDHEAFLDSMGDFFMYDDYLFVHAAYEAHVPMEQQTTEMLRWYHLTQGVPDRHLSGKTAVVGHTANRDGEIFDVGHLLCIDTYCYGGGWLTAVDLKSRTYWQTSEQGELRA